MKELADTAEDEAVRALAKSTVAFKEVTPGIGQKRKRAAEEERELKKLREALAQREKNFEENVKAPLETDLRLLHDVGNDVAGL